MHLRGHTNILKRAADPRRRLQSRPAHAAADRRRHAARAARAARRRLGRPSGADSLLWEPVRRLGAPRRTRFTARASLDRADLHRARRRERNGFHHGLLALLRAGRSRHADQHRWLAHAVQILADLSARGADLRWRPQRAPAAPTRTGARYCELSVGTAREQSLAGLRKRIQTTIYSLPGAGLNRRGAWNGAGLGFGY